MKGEVKKPLKEILYLVCWIVFLSSRKILAGATMFAINQPTECIGTGQVSIPTSVYPTSEEVLVASPAQPHQLASRIVCASYSSMKKATAFSYQGGMCTIYGAGNGLYGHFIFFVGHFMPPAEDVEDLSLNKPAYASEPYSASLTKDRAVNGIYANDNMYESKAGLAQPWWMVDLTEVRTIHQVQIFTRQGCCSHRFHDIEVRIGQELVLDGNLNSYTLMSTYKGPYDTTQGHVICTNVRGVTGRFLSIKKISSDTDHLQLVEVRIYAAKKT